MKRLLIFLFFIPIFSYSQIITEKKSSFTLKNSSVSGGYDRAYKIDFIHLKTEIDGKSKDYIKIEYIFQKGPYLAFYRESGNDSKINEDYIVDSEEKFNNLLMFSNKVYNLYKRGAMSYNNSLGKEEVKNILICTTPDFAIKLGKKKIDFAFHFAIDKKKYDNKPHLTIDWDYFKKNSFKKKNKLTQFKGYGMRVNEKDFYKFIEWLENLNFIN